AFAVSVEANGMCSTTEQLSTPCPVLHLSEPLREIEKDIPALKRRKLRMARARAARRGDVEFVNSDAESAASLFEWLVQLHGARWRTRGEPGVLADPRVLAFHRDLLSHDAIRAVMRLHAVRIAGK